MRQRETPNALWVDRTENDKLRLLLRFGELIEIHLWGYP